MIRILDLFLSTIGCILLLPILVIIAVSIKLYSRGPIFYKQVRVGRYGRNFYLLKFRTMYVDADRQGLLTVGGRDPRVTGIGYYLRKYKLDELPQLLNVIRGDMSIVGPRPEVRKYVDLYSVEQLKVLNVRPGITDWASIYFRNENELLEHAVDPEWTYINEIVPQKIGYNMRFINSYSVQEYLTIIWVTICSIFSLHKPQP